MIFKAFFLVRKAIDLKTDSTLRLCKVFAVENGPLVSTKKS